MANAWAKPWSFALFRLTRGCVADTALCWFVLIFALKIDALLFVKTCTFQVQVSEFPNVTRKNSQSSGDSVEDDSLFHKR